MLLRHAHVNIRIYSCHVYHFVFIFALIPLLRLDITRGWPGGAMVLGNLPVPGRPSLLMMVGQGPT